MPFSFGIMLALQKGRSAKIRKESLYTVKTRKQPFYTMIKITLWPLLGGGGKEKGVFIPGIILFYVME